MNLKDYVSKVPNFPKEGIVFLDVTSIFADGEAYKYATGKLAEFTKSCGANKVLGPEARGFLAGAPVATELGLPFIPVRKPGKLPRETVSIDYDLEYGSNTLCMNFDGVVPGDKVVIIDDLLATGGTVKATCELVKRLGGEVCGIAFYIALTDLPGLNLLKDYNVYSLMDFTEEI